MSSLVHPKWMSSARPWSSSAGAIAVEPLLEEVLDRLDVVHRDALDLGELGHLVGAEVVDDRPQGGDLVVGQPPHAGHDVVARLVDQPLDLDVHALPVERRLREVVDERRDRAAVAAVERTERDGRVRVSEGSHAAQSPRAADPARMPSAARVPHRRRARRRGALRVLSALSHCCVGRSTDEPVLRGVQHRRASAAWGAAVAGGGVSPCARRARRARRSPPGRATRRTRGSCA